MGLIEQKMHQVYKIPLYRETDLNRLRWLGMSYSWSYSSLW